MATDVLRTGAAEVAARDARYAGIAVNESLTSGVSWAAVLAGALVAASLGLSLTLLGVGLGLSAISPWAGAGASASAVGASAVMWLVVTQSLSAGLGGYLAGRLRVKWATVHGDEVHFRDTAHGLLVWAVGVAITAAFLTSAASSLVTSATKVAATAAAGVGGFGAATTAGVGLPSRSSSDNTRGSQDSPSIASSYLNDSMFRSDRPGADAAQAGRGETARILAESVRTGTLSPPDRTYAGQVIAAQTGLSQTDAEARVDAAYNKAKNAATEAEAKARSAADEARRAAAKTSIWIFVALLVGAFCASTAATLGGHQRDKALSI